MALVPQGCFACGMALTGAGVCLRHRCRHRRPAADERTWPISGSANKIGTRVPADPPCCGPRRCFASLPPALALGMGWPADRTCPGHATPAMPGPRKASLSGTGTGAGSSRGRTACCGLACRGQSPNGSVWEPPLDQILIAQARAAPPHQDAFPDDRQAPPAPPRSRPHAGAGRP